MTVNRFGCTIFLVLLLVAGILLLILKGDELAGPPATDCRSIGYEVKAPAFTRFANGLKVWRDSYEVEVLSCPGGTVTRRLP